MVERGIRIQQERFCDGDALADEDREELEFETS